MDGLHPNMYSSEAVWQEDWGDMLQHLDHLLAEHKVGLALQFVARSFLLFLSEYTGDHKMGKQAQIQSDLTKIQNKLSSMQEDFDAAKSATTTKGATIVKGTAGYFAKKALEEYYGTAGNPGILQLLKEFRSVAGPSAEGMISNLQSQIVGAGGNSGIFNGDSSGCSENSISGSEANTIGNAWHAAWNNTTPGTGNQSIQTFTNSFNSCSSSVGSESAQVQAKEKYFETHVEQFNAGAHTVMTSYVDLEKQSNQAMQR